MSTTATIQQTIEELLAKMAIEHDGVEVAPSELPDYIKFAIRTNSPGILIGREGEHLSAFSLIVRKIVEKTGGNIDNQRFFIDVGGYQSERIQKIQKVAHIMADRAKSFNRNVELPPMSAYDRMVVHATLAEDPKVETGSEGQGRARRVIIRYVEHII